jgi:hypothetical protein
MSERKLSSSPVYTLPDDESLSMEAVSLALSIQNTFEQRALQHLITTSLSYNDRPMDVDEIRRLEQLPLECPCGKKHTKK